MSDNIDAARQQEKMQEEAKFLARTPSEEIGPMYPVAKPEDRGDNLVAGADGKTVDGQILYIRGKVIDLTGTPIEGAEVEVWHADPHGRYPHPCDLNPAPLSPRPISRVMS
jgi:protocatechuate 3,4-dioxygenase beta subunit